jgi:hypothetical protein
MGSDLAQQSIANRLMALQATPQMAGDIRQGDLSRNAQIAAMQQRYNEFVGQQKTQAAMNAARQKQAAQAYNLANQQRIADANRQAQYQAQLDRDRQQESLFGSRLQKTAGVAGSLANLGRAASAREEARRQQINQLGSGIDSLIGQIGIGGLTGGGA